MPFDATLTWETPPIVSSEISAWPLEGVRKDIAKGEGAQAQDSMGNGCAGIRISEHSSCVARAASEHIRSERLENAGETGERVLDIPLRMSRRNVHAPIRNQDYTLLQSSQ
jgi:hypothetical protein